MKKKQFRINNRYIKALREEIRPTIESEQQVLIEKKDQCDNLAKGLYPRLQFINRYFLYAGLSKHYENPERPILSLEQLEDDLMSTFNCDPQQWPICLFDFTYKNRIPTYLTFKVEG
jgi:hypothetical protein